MQKKRNGLVPFETIALKLNIPEATARKAFERGRKKIVQRLKAFPGLREALRWPARHLTSSLQEAGSASIGEGGNRRFRSCAFCGQVKCGCSGVSDLAPIYEYLGDSEESGVAQSGVRESGS